MKIETYLNAMTLADGNVWENYIDFDRLEFRKAHRQFYAFRAHILKMDAEKEVVIKRLLKDYAYCYTGYETWKNMAAMREREITKKDARITELRAENQAMEYLLNEGENIGVE